MRYHRFPMMMLAACSLLLPASIATAQTSSNGGIVQAGAKARASRTAENCDGYGVGYGNGYSNGCGVGCSCGCNNGGKCRCGNGRGAHGRHNGAGYGYGNGAYGGSCGNGCNLHYGPCRIGQCLNRHSPHHTCKLAPDHGFSTPAHRPMLPQPAMYTRMFPGQWTGEGASVDPGARRPMIYMPTDTTQLGYYYQQVPFWRSRPGMIPPVPHPAEWHTPETGVVFTGFEDAETYGINSMNGVYGCPEGQVIDGGTIDGGVGQPTMDGSVQSYPIESTPIEASPVPMHQSVPSAPYSPQPVNPQLVPPSQEIAPELPSETGVDLGKSAAHPQLIPVPRR